MDLLTILNPDNIVSRPPRNAEGYMALSSWAEEQIWGHRLWYRQTPWLIFLEFLGIAEAMLRKEQLFLSDFSSPFSTYRLHQRFALRNLLFNNSELLKIYFSTDTDATKWDKWISWMNEECEPNRGLDFQYLKLRFNGNFSDFVRTIELLRKTTLEPETNRRWSSRFLFPFGKNSLYEDLKITSAKAERQAINFGRAGDLLYMMLSRSSKNNELQNYFTDIFTKQSVPDKLVAKLIPTDMDSELSNERTGGYLPYKAHPAYERLADDWLALFKLKMPSYDVYAHIVPLGTLHILLYLMETASAWCGRGHSPTYICEVIAPKMEFVRQRALRSFIDNDGLPRNAIEKLMEGIMSGDEWNKIESNPALLTDTDRVEEAKKFLDKELWLDQKDVAEAEDLSKLKQVVLRLLHKKLDDNIGSVHTAYGRHCGLVSKRSTRNYRYAPTDTLLKTLVLANVMERMEFSEFLKSLYQRYRFVFGPAEASEALSNDEFDEMPFRRNIERLEERLRSMGLLNRLSDGVAYIENPFISGR